MKFVLIPSAFRNNTTLSPWNRFYKPVKVVKNDKAKRPTK